MSENPETQLNEYHAGTHVASYGLMQILNTTAFNIPRGSPVSPTESLKLMTDAELNVRLGTTYLMGHMNNNPTNPLDFEWPISAYNGGHTVYRYTQADVDSKKPGKCLNWKVWVEVSNGERIRKKECERRAAVIAGQFHNQRYVDKVMNIFQQLRRVEDVEGAAQPTQIVPVSLETNQPKSYQPAEEQRKERHIKKYYRTKFGDQIFPLIQVNKTTMIRDITLHGIQNHEQNTSNSFVAPFPTTAKVEIEFMGIAGISIFDGFIVDKLPYIYERYGIFHITQIKESIDETGWKTTLTGIYRFLYFNANATGLIKTEPPRSEQ